MSISDCITAAPDLPVVEPLPPGFPPEEAFRKLRALPHCVWLDSAVGHAETGRFSFLAADPFDYWERAAASTHDLERLEARLAELAVAAAPGLPPFQGGAAGVLGYELGRALETLPRPAYDEFQLPALALGWYDVVLAWDHAAGEAWIVSQGLPELEPAARRRRAAARLRQVRRHLTGQAATVCTQPARQTRVLSAAELAPQFPVPGPAGLKSNFSHAQYLRAAERAIRYVVEGDVFQVNLAQRFSLELEAADPV
ncbi:MAG: hypothetical protein ACOCWL_03325, partial [Thermoguttaceae bacterium]